jgi:hypothetical protein
MTSQNSGIIVRHPSAFAVAATSAGLGWSVQRKNLNQRLKRNSSLIDELAHEGARRYWPRHGMATLPVSTNS